MNIDDILGNFPQRPDHQHFWRLSNIILKLDDRMDSAITKDEKDAVWTDNVGRWVDESSVTYMAVQRAYRVAGANSPAAIRANFTEIAKTSVSWLEGFQVGAEFASRSLEGATLDSLDETGLRVLLTRYERHVMESHENGTEPLSVAKFFDSIEP